MNTPKNNQPLNQQPIRQDLKVQLVEEDEWDFVYYEHSSSSEQNHALKVEDADDSWTLISRVPASATNPGLSDELLIPTQQPDLSTLHSPASKSLWRAFKDAFKKKKNKKYSPKYTKNLD